MGAVRRLWLLIIIGTVLSPLGWSQSVPISGFVIDQYGQPVAGAKVYICNAATSTGLPCTPPATIYQDFNLSSPIANPTTTDANGDFNVYVGPLAFPNVYVVNAVPQAGTTYTLLYPGPSCPLSGCTFSGNVTAPIFNATMSPYYEINGVQISSSALSDAANIAFLNASNVFTGAVQTAPIWNATGSFEVNGVALASTNLSDSANLARLNASNVFTGATNTFEVVVGTTINATTINATTINATTGYKVNGAAGSSGQALCSDGTNYNTPCSVGPGTLYYQTVDANATAQTQRPILNLISGTGVSVTCVDNSGATRTDCTLAAPVTPSQTNCLTTSCIGGSTYAASTTYTNRGTVGVLEEVTMQAPDTEGCPFLLTPTIAGVTGPVASIFNDAEGQTAAITFRVIPGATFSVVISQVGGPSCGAPTIVGWLEVIG